MDESNIFAVTVWIFVLLSCNECYARVNYNIIDCQNCSSQGLVPCKIQGMHDNCLSAMTAINGKHWPGPPRELTAEEQFTENESHALFSWKPPYDASIHSLKGFLLRITHYEDYKGNFVSGNPWCFYLNLTDRLWTESPHAYDTSFHFNCIKSKHPATITLSVSSIPRPDKNWKVVKQSVFLRGTAPFYQWRPNISVTEANDHSCVVVSVNPLFPDAYRHVVLVVLDHKTVKEVNMNSPENNVTLCLHPGLNYSIQVKPYDKDNRPMSHYVQYSPVRIEPKPIQLALQGRPYSVIKDVVAQLCDVLVEIHMDFPKVLFLPIQGLPLKPDEKMTILAWIVIPLVLVIAISLTVLVFYLKGMLQKSAADCDMPPNNITDEENSTISIVFCSENNQVEKIVYSLGKIIREITGNKIEYVSDGRNIDPTKKLLLIITEGIHQVNHVDRNYSNDSKAFLSAKNFIGRFLALQESNHLLLLSPIVSISWLDCCIFKNKNVLAFYRISENEQINLNFDQMVSLLSDICQNDALQEKIRSNLENNQEVFNLKNHLLSLYLYMRDNQRWFEEDFLGCDSEDVHQTQPLLLYPIAQESHLQYFPLKENVCLINPLEGKAHMFTYDQVKCLTAKKTVDKNQTDKDLHGNRLPVDPDVFDSGISEQNMMLDIGTKNDGRLDSGVDSMPLEEMPPFLVGNPDFLPPDSDTDSIDVDALSLGQHMLEINKRNLQAW